jgi:pyridoxal phosphate enzyme (YggS family)
MVDVAAQLQEVEDEIADAAREAKRAAGSVRLIAVSKTVPAEAILPALQAGHGDFGENRVQEAKAKWPELRERFPDLRLHIIGPLQTNKVRDAVALADVIHTIDRDKLAEAVALEMRKQGRAPRLLVQVNIGEEAQKAGIGPTETAAFVERCRREHGLAIAGLMCIPPADEPPAPYFALTAKLAKEAGVAELSMGMSGDFRTAIAFGATMVRVGTAIFGARAPVNPR